MCKHRTYVLTNLQYSYCRFTSDNNFYLRGIGFFLPSQTSMIILCGIFTFSRNNLLESLLSHHSVWPCAYYFTLRWIWLLCLSGIEPFCSNNNSGSCYDLVVEHGIWVDGFGLHCRDICQLAVDICVDQVGFIGGWQCTVEWCYE